MNETASPLVSIITPTLNQGSHIGETIASVRRQSYGAIEHIVVDGGSTDATLEILRSVEHRYRMEWLSEPDNGMYDAINKGLARAAGEILTYLNSDDVLMPWAVEAVVASFRAQPDAGIIYGDALSLDDERHRLDMRLQVPFQRDRLARFGSLVQPSVFWRQTIHDAIGGFDGAMQFVGDLDFWLRASMTERVGRLDEVLSVYRIHAGAKTSRSKGQMRVEEARMRASHHHDGRRTFPRQVLARLSVGLADRAELLRFAAATRNATDPRWARFREHVRPRIRTGSFLAALVPVASRVLRPRWLEIDLDRAMHPESVSADLS